MPHEAVDVKGLLRVEHVVEGPAQLVRQGRQRLGLAQLRRQPLQQGADALVLTRQKLPLIERSGAYASAEGTRRGLVVH